jgi:hypothetical protein
MLTTTKTRTATFSPALIAVSACLPILLLGLASCTSDSKEQAPVEQAASAAELPTVVVAIELADELSVGALQFDVSYSGAEGAFVGEAGEVSCETAPPGILSSFNHIAADKTLRAAFVAVEGVQGPTRLTSCKYQGNVSASDFTVTVRDASSPELEELDPVPALTVVVE